MWCSDVVGICGSVCINDFGIDGCIMFFSVFQFFEYDCVCVFVEDEVIMVCVKWMGGGFVIIVVGRECFYCIEVIYFSFCYCSF